MCGKNARRIPDDQLPDHVAELWECECGLTHRDDGPAMRLKSGIVCWYKWGRKHRDDDLPALYHEHDSALPRCTAWYQDGDLSRTSGPALITEEGDEYWYYRGLMHRIDGPAIILYCDSRNEETQEVYYVMDVPYNDMDEYMNAVRVFCEAEGSVPSDRKIKAARVR